MSLKRAKSSLEMIQFNLIFKNAQKIKRNKLITARNKKEQTINAILFKKKDTSLDSISEIITTGVLF